MKIVTERDISLGRLSQTGKWNIKTVAHDVVYHHLKRRRASWFFSSIFDAHLGLFLHGHFKPTSRLHRHFGLVFTAVSHSVHGLTPG